MKALVLITLATTSNVVMAQVYKPLMVDQKTNFKFKKEGKLVNWENDQDVINSDMLVNNDTLTDIQFTRAKIKRDTLNIEIYQFDESHSHHYRIQITKGKYNIKYDFSYPSDTIDRKIQTLDFMLTLNSKNLKKGQVIRGYTEFKGKCIQNCYDEIIVAKGRFKVTIE